MMWQGTESTAVMVQESQLTQSSNTKVIALKGKRQVGSLTWADQEETVTDLAYMLAMIFPRKRNQQRWTTDSGWFSTKVFLVWLKKFAHVSKEWHDSFVLLILDSHSIHSKTPKDHWFCMRQGFHTSTSTTLHLTQVTNSWCIFFKPLNYGIELRKCLQAATMRAAMKGF